MLTLLLAITAMAARDMLSTFLVVAEARGRAVMAGVLDALGDLAGFAVTIVGAGAVIQDGITPHTILLLSVMVVTSFCGTVIWTRLANHIQASNAPSQTDRIEARLSRLEEHDRTLTRLIGVVRDR